MTETDQKLKRLDDDVRDVLSILHSIGTTQHRHAKLLTELAETLGQHTPKLDSHGDLLRLLDIKADRTKGRFEWVESKLAFQIGEVADVVERLDARIDQVIERRSEPAISG